MLYYRLVWLIVGIVVIAGSAHTAVQSQPKGQRVIAFDTTIAPAYLDPAETSGIATPFVFLDALHEAPFTAEDVKFSFFLAANLAIDRRAINEAERMGIGRLPVFEPATLHGVGTRVAEPAVGLHAQLYFAAPYEEMRLHKP
jgi:hypothetical protein